MERSLRVLMVTTSFPRWKGDHAGHFIASLAEELVEQGHAVTVVAPHEGNLPESERMGNVTVRRVRYLPGALERVAYGNGIVFNLKRDPRALLGVAPLAHALRRAVRELAQEADVIHVHWAPTTVLAAPYKTGVPTVLTVHGSDVTLARRPGIWRAALARALRGVKGLNVVSREQRNHLVEADLWGDGPLRVIPAGIPGDLLDRPLPERRDARFGFVFVGRLVGSKGVLELAEAFGRIVRAGVDAGLEFVGAGPEESSLREWFASRGLSERVVFRGSLSHDDAIAAIAAADALVLPSHGEGSPLVVAEAMAVGTPVIGSNVGAIPDLLGEQGLVVEPHDSLALADAMRRLAGDAALASVLADRGRETARRELMWPVIAKRTLELYRDVLNRSVGNA